MRTLLGLSSDDDEVAAAAYESCREVVAQAGCLRGWIDRERYDGTAGYEREQILAYLPSWQHPRRLSPAVRGAHDPRPR